MLLHASHTLAKAEPADPLSGPLLHVATIMVYHIRICDIDPLTVLMLLNTKRAK